MSTNAKMRPSMAKMGLVIAGANFLMGFSLTMAQNYATYSYTDLAKIDPTTMSICMTVVNVIALIITFISGAIVTSTRSRFGNFRPWLIGANIVCLTGGFLIFFNVGNSVILKAVVISIGYLMANSSMDFIYTAKGALYGCIAGADSSARDMFAGRQWQGQAICLVVSGFAVVPLVGFLGSGNETVGFLLTQLIFTVIVMTGSVWFFKMSAPFDADNRSAGQGAVQEKASIVDMIKAVIVNRQAVTVLLSDIVRFTGYFVLFSMMVYQCTKVIGNMMAMAYVLSAANFCSFCGASIAPLIVGKIGGRKKTIALFGFLTSMAFASIGIFGRSLWGFVISCSTAFFFMSFIDTLDMMLYMDAGEYWLHKTGKDTRPYLISMYNVAVKLAMACSSVLLGVILNAINYNPDAVLDAAGQTTLTWCTGLAPAIGYFCPILIMLLHQVSDKEMQQIIKENAEKYAAE